MGEPPPSTSLVTQMVCLFVLGLFQQLWRRDDGARAMRVGRVESIPSVLQQNCQMPTPTLAASNQDRTDTTTIAANNIFNSSGSLVLSNAVNV